ncbi:MAG: purine-nucleoside phosphorylase [Alphaproteobacteria bacterium]|nr:purine-nucleoside phosphorylase [Alphaproteobacteria bacterium]
MLNNSLSYIKQRLNGFVPDTAIILGSGLGGIIDSLNNPLQIAYKDIPDFPQTTVSGHNGCLYAGTIGKHKVLCLQGRFHLYEGIAPQTIAEVISLLKNLRVKQLIITNAAGSLNPDMPEGSIMLISDHINMSGQNPLIGPHNEPYFPDMSQAYDADLRQNFKKVAAQHNISIFEGVYIMLLGPNYETPAEVKMLQNFGADAVGMSTVPEVIAAVHQNMRVLGVSIISNLATGISSHKPNHADVLQTVAHAASKLEVLLNDFLHKE